MQFSLNLESIKEIPFEKYHKDFIFFVNDKEYHINRFVADILSPKIRQYHSIDESLNTFYINTSNKSTKIDFNEVLSLISFQPKFLKDEEIEYFIEIFSILGNDEAIHKILPKYQDEITIQNVLTRILAKQKYVQTVYSKNNDNKEDTFSNVQKNHLQPELDFISKHFFEIDKQCFHKIDPKIIEEIIRNDQIKLEDEDSLLKIINDLYRKDNRYSILFEYVNFLYVSQDELGRFFDLFDIKDINHRIWKSVFQRFLKQTIEVNNEHKMTIKNQMNSKEDIDQKKENDKEIKVEINNEMIPKNSPENRKTRSSFRSPFLDAKVKEANKNKEIKNGSNKDHKSQPFEHHNQENDIKIDSQSKISKKKEISLLHKENDDFNGIFKYLTNKTGGNIHDKGIVEATSNSCFSPPKYLLDFDYDNYYQAVKSDSWVCFDFKKNRIKITKYSIRSNSGGKDLYHLKSWDVEVSNDGESWSIIDQRKNYPTLNGSYSVGTFEVGPNDYSRFVRLHQTDAPWGGGCLWFYYIEFYGYLQEDN